MKTTKTTDPFGSKVFANHGFEIIDCHIHPSDRPENFFRFLGDFPGEKIIVDELKAVGISKASGSVVFKEPAKDFAVVRQSNDIAIEIHGRNPDFYIPGVMADPRHPKESCAEIERVNAKTGTRWIGELVGYITGYGDEYDSPGAYEIYDLARALQMAVNIHTSDMAALGKIARAFPSVNFVMAHPGDGRDLMTARLNAVASEPNLHIDISGTGVTRSGWLELAVKIAGIEKILFGTDHPICVPASFIACVLEAKLTDSQREAVFSKNFRRLAL